MKAKLLLLMTLVLALLLVLPLGAQAQSYAPSQTDISLRVDDSRWYVFTRDNILNNPELDELEISYETAYDLLYNNNIYMDAVLFYDDGTSIELFVRKQPLDSGIVNLSNYDDEHVLDFAKGIADKLNAPQYEIYKNQYKFANVEYVDAALNCYVYGFFTIVNNETYAVTFQSADPYDEAEYAEMQDIVDSVRFNVDLSLKEPQQPSFWDDVLEKAVIGAVSGGIAGGLIAFITKKMKKAKANNTQPPDQTPVE